ncbi:hypothetical protein Ddc_24037 [Ditylenchus destructor]|nr:hypothetical protein Ddc_24037 [Ditylenchus destructor]
MSARVRQGARGRRSDQRHDQRPEQGQEHVGQRIRDGEGDGGHRVLGLVQHLAEGGVGAARARQRAREDRRVGVAQDIAPEHHRQQHRHDGSAPKVCFFRAVPAEEQTRQQRAAAGSQRQRDVADLGAQQADQQTHHQARAQIDEVGLGTGHERFADGRGHALDVLLGAVDGHHVADVDDGLRLHRQHRAHAAELHDEDAVADAARRGLADLSDRLLVEVLVGQHDLALDHGQLHALDRMDLAAQQRRAGDHRVTPAHDQHDVAALQHQRRAGLDEAAVALYALDGDGGGGVGVLDVRDAARRVAGQLVEAADQRGRRVLLIGAQHLHAGLHGGLRGDGVVADGAAHQLGQEVHADEDRAEDPKT